MEEAEKVKKDEYKQRKELVTQESQSELMYSKPGCLFVEVNRAGLVNHVRQKHGVIA